MKKTMTLLLIMALSACVFAGDFLNSPVIEYRSVASDWEASNMNVNPENWSGFSDYEAYAVSANATLPYASIEPGALTGGNYDNLNGLIMRETPNPGTEADVYCAVYVDGDTYYYMFGVRAYDDVISPKLPTGTQPRTDMCQIRLGIGNNSPESENYGKDGAFDTRWHGWYDNEGVPHNGTHANPRTLFKGEAAWFEVDGNLVCLPDNVVTLEPYWDGADDLPGLTSAWDTDYTSDDLYKVYSGVLPDGWWTNFSFVIDISDINAEGEYYNLTANDLESLDIAVVIKDHDDNSPTDWDMDRTMFGSLHNTDYTLTHGMGTYALSFNGSTLKSNNYYCSFSQATFITARKENRRPVVTMDYDPNEGANGSVILSWDDPTGFAGALTYKVYKCPVYDNTFNIHSFNGQEGKFYYYDGTPGVTADDYQLRRYFKYSYAGTAGDYTNLTEEMIGVDPNVDYTGASADILTSPNGLLANAVYASRDFDDDNGWEVEMTAADVNSYTYNLTGNEDEYYFLVTVLDGGVEYPVPSDIMGFRKYSLLTHAADTKMNFVGLPFDMELATAAELGDWINDRGGAVQTISQWNETAQGWNTAVDLPDIGWINNFEVVANGAYMISSETNSSFYNVGKIEHMPFYNLQDNANGTINTVLMPMNFSNQELYYKNHAGAFDDNIVNFYAKMYDGPGGDYVDYVSRWNATAQGWSTQNPNSSGLLDTSVLNKGGVTGETMADLNGEPFFFHVVPGTNMNWPVYDNHIDHDSQFGNQ
ncbi:MAG: hypothetical protein K9N06_11245 [Candidatus Cloacimonetes bacterium]|nr:hypothetical protein [Candidatus Cloacimonadota bacterium]